MAVTEDHHRSLMGGGGAYVEVPAELRQGWSPFNGPSGQVSNESHAMLHS